MKEQGIPFEHCGGWGGGGGGANELNTVKMKLLFDQKSFVSGDQQTLFC